MHVIATAGHVDHGKSTLVRALTGMEPDRWAEERRRGLTIDLGFAWTALPSGAQIAFVDVPGHERFVTNMLAGVGPAPAVMFVVAANEGWSVQSEEHLQALAALGVSRLLLVVTKADLAAPASAFATALDRIAASGLPTPRHVAVSAATGTGLDDVRLALDGLVATLPAPDVTTPVRLWIDRAFTIRGAGTVVTGTLTAGTIAAGDELVLMPAGRSVTVRSLQSQGEPRDRVTPVARVAINLRGVDVDEVSRGMALVTAGAWTPTDVIDALADEHDAPAQLTAHIGAAAVAARVRRLGGKAVRIQLAQPLPLHLGDRLVLRHPASRRVIGADVADLHPQPLRRRGDAARIGLGLRIATSADDYVAGRGWCTQSELVATGLRDAPDEAVRVGEFWVDRARWDELRVRVQARVATVPSLSAGLALPELQRELDLPDLGLVAALAREVPGVVVIEGRVRPSAAEPDLSGVTPLLARLAADPLDAPDAAELASLGLDRAELAAAVRAGRLLRLSEGVYVASTAPAQAVAALQTLGEQPFTVGAAREVLGSTRRVVVPLLEHLDAARLTRKLPDGTRLLVSRPA